MKILKLALMSLCFCFLFNATQCEEDDGPLSYEDARADLDEYRALIQNLADQSVCNENTECLFVGFGSKPCGGPWTYLIYTNSIDVDDLLLQVEDYNEQEANLNEEWGIVSDCSVTPQPSGFECIDNTCNPIF